MAKALPQSLVDELLHSDQGTELEIAKQRERGFTTEEEPIPITSPEARLLEQLSESLVKRVVWIVGGDGWAYDIGFGGLDHVLASGRNVNVLVLDTEVYSNTGGQASKSTPRAAVAKFAAAGKSIGKKDIGMIAMAYGHVYVAQIAIGAHPCKPSRRFTRPSPIRAIVDLGLQSMHCTWHRPFDGYVASERSGFKVATGRYIVMILELAHDGGKPFHLDSKKPTLPFKQFATKEARFSMLMRSDPNRAEKLLTLAQNDIHDRWHYYEQIANVERSLAGFYDEVTE